MVHLSFKENNSHYEAHRDDFINFDRTLKTLKEFGKQDINLENYGITPPKNMSRPQGQKMVLFPNEVHGYKGICEVQEKDTLKWIYRVQRKFPSRIIYKRKEDMEKTQGILLVIKPNLKNPEFYWDVQTFYPGGEENFETKREVFSFYHQFNNILERGGRISQRLENQIGESFEFWKNNALIKDASKCGMGVEKQINRGLNRRLNDLDFENFFKYSQQNQIIRK